MTLMHSQTHIPRGPSGSVSKVAVNTGGGTVGAEVGTKKNCFVLDQFICRCAMCMHTFSVLLCCQSFSGEEDSKIIARALHPKELYLAHCPATSSIR